MQKMPRIRRCKTHSLFRRFVAISPLIFVCALLVYTQVPTWVDAFFFPSWKTKGVYSPPADPFADYVDSTTGIDVNRADAETLCHLPGIGEKTAAAIIEEREKNGAFFLPEDLLAVRGIGPKKLEKIRPSICISMPAHRNDP